MGQNDTPWNQKDGDGSPNAKVGESAPAKSTRNNHSAKKESLRMVADAKTARPLSSDAPGGELT
ncbi:MAG TPA: hypothetical protein DCY79_23535, partial [Planctomycetaceae bacterium]|nr:hypothetical protein [Planctomycetaceae bacterium]